LSRSLSLAHIKSAAWYPAQHDKKVELCNEELAAEHERYLAGIMAIAKTGAKKYKWRILHQDEQQTVFYTSLFLPSN
jgi:hypothetical protein